VSIFNDEDIINIDDINPHYRGNWPDDDGDIIMAIHDGKVFYCNHKRTGEIPIDALEIHKFTIDNIPFGEWCWVRLKTTEQKFKKKLFNSYYKDNKQLYDIVPSIVAHTKDDAERVYSEMY